MCSQAQKPLWTAPYHRIVGRNLITGSAGQALQQASEARVPEWAVYKPVDMHSCHGTGLSQISVAPRQLTVSTYVHPIQSKHKDGGLESAASLIVWKPYVAKDSETESKNMLPQRRVTLETRVVERSKVDTGSTHLAGLPDHCVFEEDTRFEKPTFRAHLLP